MKRKWKLVRYNTRDNWREVPPGDVDKEQRFWTIYGAQRAKDRLNAFHYLWGSPYRFEVASREGAPAG